MSPDRECCAFRRNTVVAETTAVMTLRAPYSGVKEIARVLAEAEEEGELDFDFSLEIRITGPTKGGADAN